MGYSIGIDVGGTFTDGVAIDSEGRLSTAKVPSTPETPSFGFLQCIDRLAEGNHLASRELLGSTDLILHGTTITVNALLTKKGSRVALITTKGFRDIIEMRRGQRDFIYDLTIGQPVQLVPRHLRFGINERVDAIGNVIVPLDENESREVAKILKSQRIESIAVCFLHSFMNAEHEKRVGSIISDTNDPAYISLSSEILPLIREYERVSTTVINAYVTPVFSRYATKLLSDLSSRGYKGKLLLMHSGGGIMTVENMKKRAVYSVFSGPAAAPSVSLYFSEIIGTNNLITIDMGGTSFDVTRIFQGSITTTKESTVDRYPISVPMVEVHTIGAGGGSLAWIDSGGMLHVGPQSAGAVPGPACYGKGGNNPTVTDANVILGYLNPNFFLGGEIKLDAHASFKSVQDCIAKPLGLSTTEAAAGIFNLVNDNMTGALRTVTSKRGDFPPDFVIVAAGGAGATHACSLAANIGISRIFVPKIASFLCAFGTMVSDLKYDVALSHPGRLSQFTSTKVARIFADLERRGNELLKESGIEESKRSFDFSIDMRYAKQNHEVEIGVDFSTQDGFELNLAQLAKNFHARHERLYTYSDPQSDVELVSFHSTAIGKRPPIILQTQSLSEQTPDAAIKETRKVFFGTEFVDTPIYGGMELRYGNVVTGPAIIEDPATTVVVLPEFEALVDKLGNYHIKMV